MLHRQTPIGTVNYYYLYGRLIAKDGYFDDSHSGTQHSRPFGSSIEGENDDIGYTRHKFDTSIGLSYMQARYYDPVIGRFYSNDPVSFDNIHNFNRFAYANNNPYKYIDPDGRQANPWLQLQLPTVSPKERYRHNKIETATLLAFFRASDLSIGKKKGWFFKGQLPNGASLEFGMAVSVSSSPFSQDTSKDGFTFAADAVAEIKSEKYVGGAQLFKSDVVVNPENDSVFMPNFTGPDSWSFSNSTYDLKGDGKFSIAGGAFKYELDIKMYAKEFENIIEKE